MFNTKKIRDLADKTALEAAEEAEGTTAVSPISKKPKDYSTNWLSSKKQDEAAREVFKLNEDDD